MSDGLTPQERSAKLLARVRNTAPPAPAEEAFEFDPALIPDVEVADYPRTKVDEEIDALLAGIDIVDAYRRFCGKMDPVARPGRQESIMCSCPIPGHEDKNPSAWMNNAKKTWFCGSCQQGGDLYDLAAFHFGYSVPGYKSDGTFPQLRRDIAEAYGMSFSAGITGEVYVDQQGPPPGPAPAPPVPPVVPAPGPPLVADASAVIEDKVLGDNVVALFPDAPAEAVEAMLTGDTSNAFIDWEELVPHGTFLRYWMEACTVDDLPHEFYFMLGLQAIGFAAGTDVRLSDYKDVKANINLCMYGPTGAGKSRALGPYQKLLREALPYKAEDPYTAPTGVSMLSTPGSAETLIDSLAYTLHDPGTQQVIGHAQTHSLMKIEEFSSFVARAARPGNSLKEVLMDLYDVLDDEISIRSRGAGTTKAVNPFCQVVTTTQPRAIHAFLRRTDTESGFMNRWIFAAGTPRIEPIPYGGVQIDVDFSAKQLLQLRQWCKPGHTFTLQGQALEVWTDFFNAKLAPSKKGTVDVDSMFSRIDLMLKKIIVLFTINSKLPQPDAETVRMAISLYDYLITTYSMFGRDITFTDDTACQERLVEIVSKCELAGNRPTRREIVRAVGKKYDLNTVERSLKMLVALEMLSESKDPPGGRGRPAIRYSVAN